MTKTNPNHVTDDDKERFLNPLQYAANISYKAALNISKSQPEENAEEISEPVVATKKHALIFKMGMIDFGSEPKQAVRMPCDWSTSSPAP